jgi:hypothetical protein
MPQAAGLNSRLLRKQSKKDMRFSSVSELRRSKTVKPTCLPVPVLILFQRAVVGLHFSGYPLSQGKSWFPKTIIDGHGISRPRALGQSGSELASSPLLMRAVHLGESRHYG